MSITTDRATTASVTTEELVSDFETSTDTTTITDPAHRDWIPTCWSDEARLIPGAYQFNDDVRPWNWLELDANEAEKLWSLLFGFVSFFNKRYGERIDKQIPPCWAEHGPIVEELTTLMFARWHAFESPQGSVGGAQYWHSYTLPAFYIRILDWFGDDVLACQQGGHRDQHNQPHESDSSWAVRSEIISILDVTKRRNSTAGRANDADETPHGVEIPFLGQPTKTPPQHRGGKE